MPEASHRPYTPVPLTAVRIDGGFWGERLRVNRQHTLPAVFRQLRDTGRLAALRQTWRPGDAPVPHVFWDSDVAKSVEALAYAVVTDGDPTQRRMLDDVARLIVAAQQPDGYLNSHYTPVEPHKRFTNLRDKHELYCAGHLMEAAVAHHAATGETFFLHAMRRYADLIGATFGRAAGQRRGYCGHEEIELALVKLAHATDEPRYLRLAEYFVDERGRQPHYFDLEARARGEDPAAFWARTYAYNQSHVPVREQAEVVGHAVRAMYLYCAMTDLVAEAGDAGLWRALTRLWTHLTSRRLYVTGGIGPSGDNEGFTADYDLPNLSAYAETCASIGLVLWAHRLLQVDLDSRYADALERALYNGVLSGVSLDGESFFYENPLASQGLHHRQPWFDCACCPPNLARLLASLGQYVYGIADDALAVHLYVQSEARVTLAGQPVILRQTTDYPWQGRVALLLDLPTPTRFSLRLRLPGWSPGATLAVNGASLDLAGRVERGYIVIDREWRAGDEVVLDLPMPIERIYAHPDVRADVGRVALQRGPLVYCVEGVDHAAPLDRLALPVDAPLSAAFEADTLGGVVVVRGDALAAEAADWGDALYRATPPHRTPTPLTAVPYYAWDNRAPGDMLVWLPQAP